MSKEKTLEQLKAERDAAIEAYNLAQEKQLQLEKEETEAKKAKLLAEKETRYKEVIDVYENFEELRGNFVKDYGYFTFHTTSPSAGTKWLIDFFS